MGGLRSREKVQDSSTKKGPPLQQGRTPDQEDWKSNAGREIASQEGKNLEREKDPGVFGGGRELA